MSSWSEVAKSGDTFECPPAGQRLRFLETAADTGGEYVRVEMTLDVDSTRENAVKHVHPKQAETLRVRTGTMRIYHDGAVETVSSGESVTFEANDVHAFWNGGEEPLVIEVELVPALKTDLFMRFAFGLSGIGWTTKSGIPLNPLRLGVLMDEFAGHLYLAGIPIALQRFGAALLGPLGRLAGYSLDLDDGYERVDG